MAKAFFETSLMNLTERFLDLAVQRQSLIASNLANVDTPGYKTVDVDFQSELKSAMGEEPALAVTNPRHIRVSTAGRSGPSRVEVEGLPQRNDLNNVNIDREMTQTATNAMKFSMAAQFLGRTFGALKSAINGGNNS
jgi:flagellar basal-body rod protein FlgB